MFGMGSIVPSPGTIMGLKNGLTMLTRGTYCVTSA
jgi:hypothetical protein